MLLPTQKMIKLPKITESIIVDEKTMGIWDIINLGNKGGVINFNNNFAIEVTKSDQKWCNVYIHQYSKGILKKGQTFVSQKIIKDTQKEKELKEQLRESEKDRKDLLREKAILLDKLSNYEQTKLSTVSEETLEL